MATERTSPPSPLLAAASLSASTRKPRAPTSMAGASHATTGLATPPQISTVTHPPSLATISTVGVTDGVASITGAMPKHGSEPSLHLSGVAATVGDVAAKRMESREEDLVFECDNLRRKQPHVRNPKGIVATRSGAGMSGEARGHGASNSAKLR